MAIGMKTWLTVVVGACAAVAATLLPAERLELPRSTDAVERARYDSLLTELRRTHAELQLGRWADSLSVVMTASEPGSITVGVSGVGEPEIADWREAVATSLTDGGIHETDVRLGAFWVPLQAAAVPGVTLGASALGDMTFARLEPLPYCFTVHTVGSPSVGDVEANTSWLQDAPGPCRMMARYGAPGRRIATWLDAGAWGFGRRVLAEEDRSHLRTRSYAAMPIFGTRRHPLAFTHPVVGACMTGSPAGCARAVTDGSIAAPPGSDAEHLLGRTQVSYADLGWTQERPFSYLDDSLFADLEAQFGQEAFERFWTSDGSVEAAFASAFGVEIGDWVLAWVDAQMGIAKAGPGIPGVDFLLAMLTIGGLTAVASGAAMRRRVGSG